MSHDQEKLISKTQLLYSLQPVLSALVDRIGKEGRSVVAIDGSLYANHPLMHSWMTRAVATLTPGKSVSLINAKDGSGTGAGLAAAVLS